MKVLRKIGFALIGGLFVVGTFGCDGADIGRIGEKSFFAPERNSQILHG
jgi:hypothetical protein